MKTYHIPETDLHVSRIAYGNMHMGGSWEIGEPTAEVIDRADTLVQTAVDQGINFFDLADIYTRGKSDAALGAVLQRHPGLRDKIYLQAKCGIILKDDPRFGGGPGRYDFSYDHIVGQVETTLRRLQTDYVDVLTLHRPDPLVEPEEVARAFDELESAGKVRYFGVSNHTPMQIALLQDFVEQTLIVNQVEISLLHHHLIDDGIMANQPNSAYTATQGTLDYCRLNEILVQAWSPVAGGRLFNPPADAPPTIRAAAAEIERLAADHAVPPEAIALAWLLRHPAGIQPVLGTLRPERIVASCRADEIILSRQAWYTLFTAARGAAVP